MKEKKSAMKKISVLLFQLLLPVILITGCNSFAPCGEKNEPAAPEPAKNISSDKKAEDTPPPAKVDQAVKEEEKAVEKFSPEKTVAEEKVVKQTEVAAEKKAPELLSPPPKKRTRNHENYRRGPGMWRAFTRLSADEQKELLQIQRTDPEMYRKILQEKADKFYEAEKIRRQEIDDLTAEIKQTESITEKERLKAKLRSKLKEDFQQRLQDTRRDIEAYKRRTAKLESELQKREKNCDAIIDAILNNRLNNAPQLLNGTEKSKQ